MRVTRSEHAVYLRSRGARTGDGEDEKWGEFDASGSRSLHWWSRAVAPTAPQTSVTSDGSGEEVHLDFNARMALAARRAPGFAGIYVEDGTWRIAMKGSRALDAATRAEVRDLLISGSTGDDARAVAENRENTAVRAQASYDFAELYDWFQVVVDSVLPLDGVHWADIDERQNRIVIGVRDEGRIEVFRSRVSELPVPPAAIEVRFTPGRFTTSADLKNKARPTVGGVSIQSPTCTLGFNADRYGDSSWYAITAAHCLGSLGHVGSVSYYQPSYPHTIGTEAYTAPMFYNAQNSACPSGHWCTYADAAAIKYSIGQWQQGMVAWPTLTSGTSYSAVMYVMSEGDAYQGTDVSKVGRTTGRTAGEMLQTCVHVDHDEPLDFYLLCAWITDLEVDYGDSGGPVVEVTSGTQVRNVGLVQGFNPENASESVLHVRRGVEAGPQRIVVHHGLLCSRPWYLRLRSHADSGGGWARRHL